MHVSRLYVHLTHLIFFQTKSQGAVVVNQCIIYDLCFISDKNEVKTRLVVDKKTKNHVKLFLC